MDIQLVQVPVDRLIPNPDNVNHMDDESLQALAMEIQETGMISPIQIVPTEGENYLILGGEHRWRACKMIGMPEVPCVLVSGDKWKDRDLFDLVAFRLNNLHGSQDPEKFMKVYERIASRYGADKIQDIFKVTDERLWKILTKPIQKALKQAGVADEATDAALKEKDADKLSKKLGKLIAQHASSGQQYGSVLVSMGQKTVIVSANERVFAMVQLLQQKAQSEKKDINELLEVALRSVLGAI
jgi:ParB/RepB/Spo0J family partition protein